MNKTGTEIVYICSHEGNSDDYWVLPHKNGISVSRIVTHLSEEIFRETEWHVEVVISLDMIDGNIRWLFSSDEDYYSFLHVIKTS